MMSRSIFKSCTLNFASGAAAAVSLSCDLFPQVDLPAAFSPSPKFASPSRTSRSNLSFLSIFSPVPPQGGLSSFTKNTCPTSYSANSLAVSKISASTSPSNGCSFSEKKMQTSFVIININRFVL